MKRKANIALVFLFGFVFFFLSCREDEMPPKTDMPVVLELPDWLEMPEIPDDNALTENRITLGRKLFFEPALSRDSSVSCSSCHLPERFFADNLPKSQGIDETITNRNSPSLFNVAFLPHLFSDGGAPSLELQVLSPIEAENEMDNDIFEVVNRLQQNSIYVDLAEKAYGRKMDAFVLTRAIAAYERTLISANSRFDQFYYQQDSTALTSQEMEGMNLFFSPKTNCNSCHSGVLFTDFSFKNTGLYADYADEGRKRVSLQYEDEGKFRVPSLRNVAETAPYMHDGSRADLAAVVEHYNKGGEGHFLQDLSIQPLGLTDAEKASLIAFLETLTTEN